MIGGGAFADRTVKISHTLCDDGAGRDTGNINIWKNIFLHEMFHVFGIGHTHARPDRDEYITVLEDNIQEKFKSQYDKCEQCPTYGPYECNSIMHYVQAIRKRYLRTSFYIDINI